MGKQGENYIMTIFRLYYITQEQLPPPIIIGTPDDDWDDDWDYVDWVDKDVTIGYFANKSAINKWIDKNTTNDGWIEEFNIDDNDLQMEEITVVE
jgi:hypothetical protein